MYVCNMSYLCLFIICLIQRFSLYLYMNYRNNHLFFLNERPCLCLAQKQICSLLFQRTRAIIASCPKVVISHLLTWTLIADSMCNNGCWVNNGPHIADCEDRMINSTFVIISSRLVIICLLTFHYNLASILQRTKLQKISEKKSVLQKMFTYSFSFTIVRSVESINYFGITCCITNPNLIFPD